VADNYLTQIILPGLGGVDLEHSLDQIGSMRVARLTNCIRTTQGELTGRPGQTFLWMAAANIHTVGRLNDRIGNTFTYVVGAAQAIYCGMSGNLTLVDSGYSLGPFTFVPYHPPVSGDTWMIVADSQRMSKIRASDCLRTPLGLGVPTTSEGGFRIDEFRKTPQGSMNGEDRVRYTTFGFNLTSVGPGAPGNLTAYATQEKTTIDTMEVAAWTNNAGSGAGPANAVDNISFKQGTGSIKFTAAPGAGAYFNFWNKANVKNLAIVGARPAADEDIIHLWLRVDRPDIITEIRLYFVCSVVFTTNILPGTDIALNTDAYFHAFRPSDFTAIVEASATTTPTSATANATLQTMQQLPGITDDRAGAISILLSQTERSRSASSEFALGRGSWTEYGIIGLPLRRGDFKRIGTDTTREWSGVTGLVVSVHVSTNTAVNVWIDDIYLTGGYNLDTSLPGMAPYNYRYINTDPRTGAKSNPSPPQRVNFALDSLRQGIIITPKAYGDPAIRQYIYREGGTLTNNWYPVGLNGSDGGSFTDGLSDLTILGAAATVGTLQTNNDQPVTTVDASGNPVLAQPLPTIWGPIQDVIFGCGDPYRKGHLYWSKPTEVDHWPAANNVEVCSPSEELMGGIGVSGISLVFSRERMYTAIINLSDAGIVNITPTACQHGLVSKRGLCITPLGVAFVSKDGIYITGGGSEQNITDELLRSLFHGEAKNGYLPIDYPTVVPDRSRQIRLICHDNELWFQYADTAGTNQIFIYSLLFKYWRHYQFATMPREIYSVEAAPNSFLIIGNQVGKGFTHNGTTDDGVAITATCRTGALDQQLPRVDKAYGDHLIDCSGTDPIRINTFLNNETQPLPQVTVTPTALRSRFYRTFNTAGPPDVYGRNVTLEYTWTTTGAPPVIYEAGLSYIPEPDTTTSRVTAWDHQGRLSDKMVKGILFELDTSGVDKVIALQADGVTQVSLTVNANGRQVKEYAFPQFRGRVLRLAPVDTTDTTPFKIYQFRWIFDEEPLGLTRWESQPRDHGVPAEHTLLYANITIQSSSIVTLQITTFRADGTSTVNTYQIPSSAGAKQKMFIPFNANKGVLHKYLFSSDVPFWLYREESNVMVQAWGAQDMLVAHPFGNDDNDPARGMADSALTAARQGG